MKKVMLAAAVAVAGALGGAWAQEGPPKPGPEHKKVAFFAGTWNFRGEAKASPMGPGGPMTFKETCEMFEGGFALVCRSEGKSPMGPTKSLSIMSYDVEKKTYTYTAAESNSPVFTALGQTADGTWTWGTESKMAGKMMKTKVTIKETGPTSYEFRMELASDGGAFTPFVEGKATRVGT
ncbi:MAG: DUF1579 family protein [Vicinamibacterales bacterium]